MFQFLLLVNICSTYGHLLKKETTTNKQQTKKPHTQKPNKDLILSFTEILITCTIQASDPTYSYVHAHGYGPPKSMTLNGSYPSASNSEIIFPDSFTVRTRRGSQGSLCLTCGTHKKFTEIGLNQHFRKLFNLMLKTPGNGKSTASPGAGLTQRNGLVFQSSHFNFQPIDSYCDFDLKS